MAELAGGDPNKKCAVLSRLSRVPHNKSETYLKSHASIKINILVWYCLFSPTYLNPGVSYIYIYAGFPFLWKLDQEDGVAEVFEQSGLRYETDLRYSRVGDHESYPWIPPSAFLRSMIRTGDFKRLLGGRTLQESQVTLTEFWKRYEQQYPTHELFQVKTRNLANHLPIYVHGDEGTTYKRKGVLCIAFQSPIGYGARHSPNERPEQVNDAGIPLNLLRTSLQTRFLTAVCPKDIWTVLATFYTYVKRYRCWQTTIYILARLKFIHHQILKQSRWNI